MMDAIAVVHEAAYGTMIGASYALLALGFTLILGVVRPYPETLVGRKITAIPS
jgi:hypothetical protein